MPLILLSDKAIFFATQIALRGIIAIAWILADELCDAHAQPLASSVYLDLPTLQHISQTLAVEGITFVSHYNGEFAADPAGGARPGAAFTPVHEGQAQPKPERQFEFIVITH